MKNGIVQLFLCPSPVLLVTKTLIKKLKLGTYKQRMSIYAVERPHYAFCVYKAATLAKKLGYERVSVVEFGVAGGNGLMNLEYHAQNIQKLVQRSIFL